MLNVWFRDLSPAAIKNEPEEDNGFYSSPQHNKASRQECGDEEFVSLLFYYCTSFTCHTYISLFLTTWLACRFDCKPKKVKTEHDKKTKKRKHEYEEEDEEEEVFNVFCWLCLHFQHAGGLFFKICSFSFQDIKPKKKKKDKNVTEGKKSKKDEEKWKWWEVSFSLSEKNTHKCNLLTGVLLIRWEEERSTDGSKWRFLEHKGPVFAPPYEPLPDKVRFYYDGGSDCISVFRIYSVSPVLNRSVFDFFCRQADETRRSRWRGCHVFRQDVGSRVHDQRRLQKELLQGLEEGEVSTFVLSRALSRFGVLQRDFCCRKWHQRRSPRSLT